MKESERDLGAAENGANGTILQILISNQKESTTGGRSGDVFVMCDDGRFLLK